MDVTWKERTHHKHVSKYTIGNDFFCPGSRTRSDSPGNHLDKLQTCCTLRFEIFIFRAQNHGLNISCCVSGFTGFTARPRPGFASLAVRLLTLL